MKANNNKTSEFPVHITPIALEKIKEFLPTDRDPVYLRLGVEAGGCHGVSYAMGLTDEKVENDREFEMDSLRFLIHDASLEPLKGCILDYNEAPVNAGFQITNPFAVKSCGCEGGCG